MRQLRPVCSHCIYWVEDHTSNPPTAGHCHRFPPGIYINPDGVVVQKFPMVDHHQWCGEWSGDEAHFADAVRQSVTQSLAKSVQKR